MFTSKRKRDSFSTLNEEVISIGGFLNHRLGKFIPEQEEPRSKDYLEELLENGRKAIFIVAGEFDRTFYTHEIGAAIANCLVRGAKVKIVLEAKDKNDRTRAIEILKKKNSPFFGALKEGLANVPTTEESHFEEFIAETMDNMIFYCTARRPKYHFSVVDNDIFIESLHGKGKPRSVFIKKDSVYFRDKYIKAFENLTGTRITEHPIQEEVNTELVYSVNAECILPREEILSLRKNIYKLRG